MSTPSSSSSSAAPAVGGDPWAAFDATREAAYWRPGDFAGPSDWTLTLTAAMVAEIEAAAAGLEMPAGGPAEITAADFPLPETAGLLAEMHRELDRGRGFAVLAGLPVARYSDAGRRRILSGLAAHFGRISPQNHKRDMIIDVVDQGLPYSHASRGYASRKRLPFHTDGADFVGLLCLGMAAEGGQSYLASAAAVYHHIQTTRPELLAPLKAGFYHHRRGEQAPGEPPVSAERLPVFGLYGGLFHCCYNRNPIDWATREGVTLSDLDRAALDYLDQVVESDDFCLEMDLEPGQLQVVNNYMILHSRNDYVDDAAAGYKRHLLRIWLNDPSLSRAGPTLQNLYAPDAARYQFTPEG